MCKSRVDQTGLTVTTQYWPFEQHSRIYPRVSLGHMLGRPCVLTISSNVTSQLQSLLEIAQNVSSSNIDIVTFIAKLQNTALPPDLRYTWVQEPVKFEDALGRVIPVPSEYDVEVRKPILVAEVFSISDFFIADTLLPYFRSISHWTRPKRSPFRHVWALRRSEPVRDDLTYYTWSAATWYGDHNGYHCGKIWKDREMPATQLSFQRLRAPSV